MRFFRKNATRVISALLLLVLLASLLASCTKTEAEPITKDTLVENMNSPDSGDYKFSLDYIKAWGFPKMGLAYDLKFKNVEHVYHNSYYKANELPSLRELAYQTCTLFLEHFYDEIDHSDGKAVSDAMISCYVASIGDDYSVYRTADEDEEYTTDMSGTFVGIGVGVIYSYIDQTITVTDVYPDSGAADAGILPGDLIIKADGKTLEELGYNKLINSIRGEEGTRVLVTVIRNGEEITFDVQRKKVVEQSVSYSIGDDGIGYIKISSFKDNTAAQFIEAVDAMKSANVRAVIYDLRSNSGGYLHAVVEMISYIAPYGAPIASFSNGYASKIVDTDKNTFLVPCVVLCNEYTASAGELFTAAIRDYGEMGHLEATLVGTNTFGKGIMQSGVAFTDGSSLTFTVCYYNPPSGINYHGVGIAPDVIVELSESTDNQLSAAYTEIYELLN